MLNKIQKFTLLFFMITASVAAQQWSKINTTGIVQHLKNHSAIYDPVAGRMIVYGGRTTTGISGDVYSLNLSTLQWNLVNTTGTPPAPRYTANAYFDSAGYKMIIWSGQGNGNALFNDVWELNLSTFAWQKIWADSNVSGAPLRRYGASSVFEPSIRNFTTFAGFTTSGRFEDTWSFNVVSHTWMDRTNTPHPPKRCLHSSVYAGDLGRFIIYGGQDTGPLDDIWSCNLTNFVWTNITPAVKPPGRFWNSIIYSKGGSIIVFGGLASAALGDMWKFSLNTGLWESVNQGSIMPKARWGQTAIYIPSEDKMIMFGGEGDSSFTDTWQFTNVSVIGVQQVSNNVPAEYLLEQNYPNPFNPITNVKFQIPNAGFVKLTVFDVLGREVSTLVNEQLQAGTYEFEWDGSGFSSGIYYYNLQTENFSDTRKMVLIK